MPIVVRAGGAGAIKHSGFFADGFDVASVGNLCRIGKVCLSILPYR
jgi:hypothetical protein